MRRYTVLVLILLIAIALASPASSLEHFGCAEGESCTGTMGCLADYVEFSGCYMTCYFAGEPWAAGQCDWIW